MRVAVYGLWHLGCVTAACLAEAGHRTVGLDPDARVVEALRAGSPPLQEPGLAELVAAGLASGRLRFTTSPLDALADAEVVWVTFDTPVDDHDAADVAHVRARLASIGGSLRPGTLVLVSSQVPVGFTRSLEQDWRDRGLRFAYSPENLRLGRALESFRHPDRVVVGRRTPGDEARLAELFAPLGARLEWMSVESAEMTKHALNAFLATSVAFVNELARLCERTGADAKEVERGLRSEGRIGRRAYLAPGPPLAGGTLARDVRFLADLGDRERVGTPLFQAILASNELHKAWLRDKVRALLDGLDHPVAAVLGLTYTPGTSTLRRSASVELCSRLSGEGVHVRAHDPAVGTLPEELGPGACLCASAREALRGADVAIVATEWPDYQALRAEDFLETMRRPQVVDQGWFLAAALAQDARLVYVAPGRAAGAGEWT